MGGRTEKSTRKEKLRLGEEDEIKHRIFTRWGWEAGNKRNINGQTLFKKKKRLLGEAGFLILKILTLSAVSDYVDHEVLTVLVVFITSF